MKIYLAGSISGGRQYREGIGAISDILQKNGHEVLTPFVVDEELNKKRFPEITDEDERATAIFEEDMRLILESDVIVAEISEPSTGVGIELGVVLGVKMFTGVLKPTLALRHDSLHDHRISALLSGNKFINLKYYNLEESGRPKLEQTIVNFLRNVEIMEGIMKWRERK